MLRLVLIGKTGSGKSETGNTILGRTAFKAAISGTSVTRESLLANGNFEGRAMSVVDTPGLFDTGETAERITREVGQCDVLSRPGPHALLLVIRVGRFTEEERKTVDMFAQQFGQDMYKYLIILFTGCDNLAHEGGSTIQTFISTAPPVMRDLLNKASNRYVAFNNLGSEIEKKEQVRKLLRCVDEMVTKNGGGHYTTQMYKAAQKASREVERQRLQTEQQAKSAEIARMRAAEEARNRELIQQEQLRQQQELQRQHAVNMQAIWAAQQRHDDDNGCCIM